MTILEFVEKYNNLNSDKAKEQMLKSHIKRTYCPIIEKRVVLGTMLDNSIKTTDRGVKYIDMTVSRINYTMALIALYTDLRIDQNEDKKGMIDECYDSLVQNNLIQKICVMIGENEITEFASINADIIHNFEASQGSLQAIVADYLFIFAEKVGVAAGVVLENMDNIMQKIGR